MLGVSIDAVGLTRLAAVLAKAGAEITLVCSRGLAISSSRFIRKRICGQPGRQAVCSALAECIAARPQFYDWVVICDEPLRWAYLTGLLSRNPVIAIETDGKYCFTGFLNGAPVSMNSASRGGASITALGERST